MRYARYTNLAVNGIAILCLWDIQLTMDWYEIKSTNAYRKFERKRSFRAPEFWKSMNVVIAKLEPAR